MTRPKLIARLSVVNRSQRGAPVPGVWHLARCGRRLVMSSKSHVVVRGLIPECGSRIVTSMNEFTFGEPTCLRCRNKINARKSP